MAETFQSTICTFSLGFQIKRKSIRAVKLYAIYYSQMGNCIQMAETRTGQTDLTPF